MNQGKDPKRNIETYFMISGRAFNGSEGLREKERERVF